jgi:cytochrome c biogenesis protein CcdA
MTSILIAYLAGVVTILSPCILPLLPIVLGGSLSSHRLGPFALASGLVLAFTGFGLLVATAGFAIGLTPKLLNQIAAVLMIGLGGVLLSASLQQRFAVAASAATSGLNAQVSNYAPEGLSGQFILGGILGAVWTPCVGPTLGAAIALAAQGQSIAYAGTVMFAYGLGTVTPLVGIMLASREAFMKRRGAMLEANRWLKPTLGLLLITLGALFLSGLMSDWEAYVLDHMPESLVRFIYAI